MKKLAQGLTDGQEEIVNRFRETVSRGRQNKDLPDGMKACGQYLDERGSPQKGLHGSSAALRVLADSPNEGDQKLVAGLVAYLSDMDAREANDRDNTIKLSESLYALEHVSAAVGPTEEVRQELAARLDEGRCEGEGWAYFLSDGTPQPLPTAFAVMALTRYGNGVTAADIRYLVREIEEEPSRDSDIFVRIACLYVLAFLSKETLQLHDAKQIREKVHDAVLVTWQAVENLLDYEIEANVEYIRDGDHRYVRVPWQLYLIAVTAKSQKDRKFFASRVAQQHLQTVVRSITETDGFTYPHSGDHVSARTYGILYDVFEKLLHEIREIRPATFLRYLIFGWLRVWWPRAIAAVGLAYAAWILFAFLTGVSDSTQTMIGAGIIAGFVVEILAGSHPTMIRREKQ